MLIKICYYVCFSFMSVLGEHDGKMFLILSVVGHYSLFPLLYPKNLLAIKLFLLLTHAALAFCFIPKLYLRAKQLNKRRRILHLPMLNSLESLYLYGLLGLFIYENALHKLLGHDKKLPFLPLMLTSVYCCLGVIYFWISYYRYFLSFNLSREGKSTFDQPVKKTM